MSYSITTSTMNSPVYTISTGGTTTGLSYDYSNISWATSSQNLSGASLEVKGDANFEGDLKVKGKSIVESLDRIEERLAILRPNEELEAKWENLRGLRNAYMELEKEILEKQEMWDILKK